MILINVFLLQLYFWESGMCEQCILQGSPFKLIPFSEAIVNHTIIGPVMFTVNAVDMRACEIACLLADPDLCNMVNYYPKTQLCELLYKDRPGEYSVEIKRGCHFKTHMCTSSPCGHGGYCSTPGEPSNQTCLCKHMYSGKFCDRNMAGEVCIGVMNNDFASVIAPKDGAIKTFKLVHIRGGVSISHTYPPGNFGSLKPTTAGIEIGVTDATNTRIIPSADYPLIYASALRYDIPGYTPSSSEIILPDLSPALSVIKGEEFRLWFGQDLLDTGENNNVGPTCVLVYFVYTDSLVQYIP